MLSSVLGLVQIMSQSKSTANALEVQYTIYSHPFQASTQHRVRREIMDAVEIISAEGKYHIATLNMTNAHEFSA